MERIMTTIHIPLPDEIVHDLSLNQDALTDLAREALLVQLYARGELASGTAAQLLGISRRAFLDLVGQYGVSIFDEQIDLAAEIRHGRD
jgi:predicted HTH domain antitoxin